MAKDISNEFTVRFGKAGRTLEYDDRHGHILFTIDTGSKGNKSLCLEHHAPRTPRSPQYNIAFERAKKYLEACGYEVEIYGE